MPALPHEFVEEAASGITAGIAANRRLYGDEEPAIVLTFGYPAHGKTGESRSVEVWLERADRKPLDELVERI